jgi:hypothetical protein
MFKMKRMLVKIGFLVILGCAGLLADGTGGDGTAGGGQGGGLNPWGVVVQILFPH